MVVGIFAKLQQPARELPIQQTHDADFINVPTPTKTVQCSHKPLYLHLPPSNLHTGIYAIRKETVAVDINFI